MVPIERDHANMISTIPQFTYIRNEQPFVDHKKRRHRHRSHEGQNEQAEKESSQGTCEAMPTLANPRQFRWKSAECKGELTPEAAAAK